MQDTFLDEITTIICVHTHIYRVDILDSKLNVLSQIADWQISHTGSQDWTDKGLVV